MNYSRISLTTPSGISLALSNTFSNVVEVEDAIEDAKNSTDLRRMLLDTENYAKQIILDRETEDYVRFKIICNMCGNVEYLKIFKK